MPCELVGDDICPGAVAPGVDPLLPCSWVVGASSPVVASSVVVAAESVPVVTLVVVVVGAQNTSTVVPEAAAASMRLRKATASGFLGWPAKYAVHNPCLAGPLASGPTAASDVDSAAVVDVVEIGRAHV